MSRSQRHLVEIVGYSSDGKSQAQGGHSVGGGAVAIVGQLISFGASTLANAGGAKAINSLGAETDFVSVDSVVSGTGTGWSVSSGRLIRSSTPATSNGAVLRCTTAAGVADFTIVTTASAYSVKDATELAAVVALGTGTVSGKTILGRAGDYIWVDAVWANKAYSSQVTIQSHVTTRGSAPAWNSLVAGNLISPMRLIVGNKQFTAAKNIRFSNLDFYAPFTVGGSQFSIGLELKGEADGLIIEDCSFYGNLSAIVATYGISAVDDTDKYVWGSGMLASGSSALVGAGGLTIQRCSFHDASRLIAVGHDSETSGDTSVGPMLIDKNDCYNWHSDGITPIFNISGAVITRNTIHSPLSKLGSPIHADGIQNIPFWDVDGCTVSRNIVTMANLTGNAGTSHGHQGMFFEDLFRTFYLSFFTSDEFTKGTGWSISGGNAVYAGGGTNSQLKKAAPQTEQTIAGRTYITRIYIGTITNSTGNLVARAVRSGGGDPHSQTWALNTLTPGGYVDFSWIAAVGSNDYDLIIEASSSSAQFTLTDWFTLRAHNRTAHEFTMNFVMADQTHGISLFNNTIGKIIGNTVIGRKDWFDEQAPGDAIYPSIFSTVDWFGTGGANIIADNTALGFSSDWPTDILTNNVAVAFGTPAAVAAAYTSPPANADGRTIQQLLADYTQKTGGPLDTPIPKPTATAYVDWTSADRPWDHPRLNVVDAFTVTDLTSQVISTQVTSGATQITNIDKSDGATSVNGALVWIDTLNSTLVSPQFRITSDAGGSSVITNWTSTPAIIQQGQYLWVRGTSSGSAATATTAKVYVGPTFDTWSVTTAAAGVTFTSVAFDGATDYLTRGGNFTGLVNGEEFTLVFRIRPTDTGGFRTLIHDAQDNILIYMNTVDHLQGYMWGAAERIGFQTTATVLNADGMVTIYIAGRTTSGSEVFQIYKDGTDITPIGYSHTAGTMDFTPTDWSVFANASAAALYTGSAEFVWFDNVYYDISNSTIRDKWLAANINADGSGPGAQPKLFKFGNAAAWNASPVVNLGTGGNLIMHGAVS